MSESLSKLLTTGKIRLETIYIRFRAWIRTVVQAAAIGVFLGGVYALWTVHAQVAPTTLLGYSVPTVGGLAEPAVLLYGGILATVFGLALALKLITGRATPP